MNRVHLYFERELCRLFYFEINRVHLERVISFRSNCGPCHKATTYANKFTVKRYVLDLLFSLSPGFRSCSLLVFLVVGVLVIMQGSCVIWCWLSLQYIALSCYSGGSRSEFRVSGIDLVLEYIQGDGFC